MKTSAGKETIRKNRETIRIRAVRRILSGESPEFTSRIYRVHRSTVYSWLRRYRDGKLEGLKNRPITGRPRKLTEDRERIVYETLTANPLRFGFDSALWTREMVVEYIRDEFDTQISAVQAGRLLRKFCLVADKPLKRVLELNPARVERWLSNEYLEIVRMARKNKAAVYFVDETCLKSQKLMRKAGNGASLNPAKIQKLHMLSAVTTKGSMRFMVIRGKPTPARFVKFLKRLLYDAAKPIYLIVDGHEYQRSQRVHRFVLSVKGVLKMFHLPVFRPEMS